MLRRSPRALLLWVAAAIVAVATTVYVADILGSLRHQDQAFGRVHTVVVAARDLSARPGAAAGGPHRPPRAGRGRRAAAR